MADHALKIKDKAIFFFNREERRSLLSVVIYFMCYVSLKNRTFGEDVYEESVLEYKNHTLENIFLIEL